MPKPRRWRKDPYYKVQVFNETFRSWKDERGAFDTVEDARTHIAGRLATLSSRIMEVRRESRRVIEDVLPESHPDPPPAPAARPRPGRNTPD